MSNSDSVKIWTENLNLWFGNKHVLRDINLGIVKNRVTSIMGPSGCGKSTLIRTFNRMNDIIEGCRVKGAVYLDGTNLYDDSVDVVEVRRRVGMVFQKPNPFPKSVYENVAFGPKIHGIKDRSRLDEIVESSLRKAALWDEVKDGLDESALSLSGGQQQRLCIARALAINPEVVLMDEPCSALDPIATAKIEDLMRLLAKDYTVVVVTHNMQQAARVSDFTAFMYMGGLAEYGSARKLFESPENPLTEKYITGKFG
ncbi:MAG: phosphate ABC transporter ATP-binding protein PstB [Candidatus Bathyarchaeia archaeon]